MVILASKSREVVGKRTLAKSRHGIRKIFIANLKLPTDASLKSVRDFRDFRNHDDCLVIFYGQFCMITGP